MNPLIKPAEREFELSESNFDRLRALVATHTGISLGSGKRDLVYGRLTRRLRELGIGSFDHYCELIENGHEEEIEHFANAITTNLTSFFREKHHFEYLANTVLPEVHRAKQNDRHLRIWSAGCSTGQEPYSLAMILNESISDLENKDVRILATDLDTNVLETATRGIYRQDHVTGISDERLQRWFSRGTGSNEGNIRVSPALQRLIAFKHLNLMGEWPMQGKFDAIFCRNVLIYFDRETQKKLVERFERVLAPHGYLFIGHSETLHRVTDKFELIGQTVYRKAGR